MRALPLPSAGPIHFDCRPQSSSAMLRNLDETLRRMRPGPRVFVIRVGGHDVRDAAVGWARSGGAPHSVAALPDGFEVRVYLLPHELGDHPCVAFVRSRLDRAVAGRAVSETGQGQQASV